MKYGTLDRQDLLNRALIIARGLHDVDTDNADVNDLREYAEQGAMLADYINQLDGLLEVKP